MTTWNHKLFSDGDLTDFLITRWNLFLANLVPHPGEQPKPLTQTRVQELELAYHLQTPELGKDHRIVEHGDLSQSEVEHHLNLTEPTRSEDFDNMGDFIEARIHHQLILLKHSTGSTYVIVETPFHGSANLLLHRPSGTDLPSPQGLVAENSIRMRFARLGSDDGAWKTEFKLTFAAIATVLEQSRHAVCAFNQAVSNHLSGCAKASSSGQSQNDQSDALREGNEIRDPTTSIPDNTTKITPCLPVSGNLK
jgi:hypothetical protein